ncbi:MAG: protein-glutamate O-methyltransferase CheR, partial [Myxococcota bacterium]
MAAEDGEGEAGAGTALPDDLLERLTALLGPRLDVQLANYKRATIGRRIARRMGASGHATAASYLDRLAADPVEQEALAADLLIGVTAFFRNPDAFQALRDQVIAPMVRSADPVEPVRVWVAGCATGEEAYSVAIVALEEIARVGRPVRLQVFATDVDPVALATARAGAYPSSTADAFTASQLARFFRFDGDNGLRVRSELRDVVSFAVHDLCADPPFSRMDLVTCRNVLIYLQPGTQQQVLKFLHFALKPEAHLFLGTSEALGASRILYATVSKHSRLFRKIGVTGPIALNRPAALRYRLPAPEIPERARPGRAATGVDRARQALLDARVPPSVVVAADGAVLYAHGRLDEFLQFPTGEPRLDLGAVLRPDLATRVRGALYQSRRDHVAVSVVSSPVEGEGSRRA